MADQYLTIATIAKDHSMIERVSACAAQQGVETGSFPQGWANENAYIWASSPTWAEKWDYAVANNILDPGSDPAVITDQDILAQVQAMTASE